MEQKGQRYLIEIAKRLKDKGLKFKILIAGEGKCLDQLKQLAMELSVSNEINFLGFVKDIRCFMNSIDIFVLPSLWEGFGYVIVEAMAAGKPVVAFDVSSNPEIIRDEKSGYLVNTFDVNAFAENKGSRRR